MKKIHLLLLLPLLFSTACKSFDTIPFNAGDNMDDLLNYLEEKEIRIDKSFYDTSFSIVEKGITSLRNPMIRTRL